MTIWADYERGLVQRGDVRFWIKQNVLDGWMGPCRVTPGEQRRFSNLAIKATLTLGAVYRLPVRQTEGFVRSLLALIGAELPALDHTTLSPHRHTVTVNIPNSAHKRPTDIVLDSTGLKFYGAGEWAHKKHGETRRSWRKLHISVDPASSEIVVHELSDDDNSDAAIAGTLVSDSGGNTNASSRVAPMTAHRRRQPSLKKDPQSHCRRPLHRRVSRQSLRPASLIEEANVSAMRRIS